MTSEQILQSGLNALFSIANNPSTVNAKNIQEIPIEQLTPGTYQTRTEFNEEKLKELADSIKQLGILQPIVARQLSDKQFEIIAGERRWRAAKWAELKTVPVILKQVSEETVAAFTLIENIQRANLNPIEEAKGYEKLLKTFRLTHREIAERVGKPRSTVSNYLRLLTLSETIQGLLVSGRIEIGHAKILMPLTEDYQSEVLKEVLNKQLTVRQTQQRINQFINTNRKSEEPRLESNSEIEKELIRKLSDFAEVISLAGKKPFSFKVNFNSEIDIQRLLKLLD
jgi:ParB family chromosome partitioning protein